MAPNDRKIGECECCDKTQTNLTLHYGNMWFCDECWQREQESTKQHMSPEAQQARVDALVQSQKVAASVDSTIEVRTDLFNAATVAIVELKKSIDDNTEITNKPYALAEQLKARFEHFQSVVFELNKQIVDATNNQKAIQVYLNNLANQLRAEEREKLRIQDINYKPTSVKSPTVKAVTTRQTTKKTKLDKVELRKAAASLGVAEFTLQMVCVSKGISVDEAVKILRASIDAAKTTIKPAPIPEPTVNADDDVVDMDAIVSEE